MSQGAHGGTSRLAYPGTLAMLGLALAFPIALMVFNPTLMFERGWEQYVGTTIYLWAVVALGRELIRLWKNERAFGEAPGWLAPGADGSAWGGSIAPEDRRVLPARLRQLAAFAAGTRSASVDQLMEVNRE